MTITVSTNTASGTPRCVSLRIKSVTSSVKVETTRTIPLSIPRNQLYFWTSAWQEGERRSIEDIRAGRTQEFDNFEALARHLLSPE
mgnify:CR=1 FL=1